MIARVADAANEPIEIRAVEAMRFDPPRKKIDPGQKLVILFQNADATDQPHNLVIVKPGSLKHTVEAALALGVDGPVREFVPATGSVLAASRLLTAGQREELVFEVPPESGIYPYVCTFPGHGFVMFGAFYAGMPMPPERKDPNIPQTSAAAKKIAPDRRPMVRRAFLPDCGPAAIAVALPGRQNFCWDAGACRLRYVWEGGFLDAEDYFKSKGQANAKLLGKVWWTAPAEFPLRIGAAPMQLDFKGYQLVSGIPTFEYTVDGIVIKERLTETRDGGIRRDFEIGQTSKSVDFTAGVTEGVAVTSDAGPVRSGKLELPPGGNGRFGVTLRRQAMPSRKHEP